MICDYHLHTARCGHARGTMEEYVRAAERQGIKEIGFADHLPMYWLPREQRDPELGMDVEELPGYLEEIHRLRERFPAMDIKAGIEADYIPGREKDLGDLLSCYPFDYVMGSVHFVDGWGFDNPAQISRYRDTDIDVLFRRYFRLLQQAAGSGLFHIMAHPDLVKKFGFRPKKSLAFLYRETARAFQKAGVAVEINTAGLRAPVGEIYPHPDFIRQCAGLGIEFTLGSDAHAPEQVGGCLEKALAQAGPIRLRRMTRVKNS